MLQGWCSPAVCRASWRAFRSGLSFFPFTVRAAGAGYGRASLEERAEPGGILGPLLGRGPAPWPKDGAGSRGTTVVGARPARDGLDAARAVRSVRCECGHSVFERYGFVKRQGLAYLGAGLDAGGWSNPAGNW